MEKKRPQLSLDELRQVRWLLGGATALIGAWAVAFLDVGGWLLLLAGTVAIPLVMVRPAWPARVPALAHRLAFPLMAAWAAYDFYAAGEPLTTMTRLALLLLIYRATSYRRRRDDLQLVVLGLFLVVVAGVLTISVGFAFQIMAFTAAALALLMAITLTETVLEKPAPTGLAPEWAARLELRKLVGRVRAAADWRVVALGGALFAGVAVLSGVLFLAIPRFELGNSLFLEGLMQRKGGTGFTDEIHFGDITDLQKDESVAMRVDVSERASLPRQLYWRMIVLDEYRGQAFRLSPALKAAEFSRQTVTARIVGNEPLARGAANWTMYLEPGVGRYLPLAGGFRQLFFTEPQSVQLSPCLRVIALSREPMAMKAYRVQGMTARATLGDPGFGEKLRAGKLDDAQAMREIALSPVDREAVLRAVAEITGGADLAVAEFADKAQAWLGARHRYSLSMSLPAGDGDPLVRWMISREPGHCELFAGAFTLLARAAGHPTRMIAGFAGGTWNKDYLLVRNSDAHAWCEIFDGEETWLRIDPTRAAGGGSAESAAEGLLGGAGVREAAGGWSERLDRLRLFWYRRIVNFDQRDQVELARVVKQGAANLGKVLQKKLAGLREAIRDAWRGVVESSAHLAALLGGLLVLLAVAILWRRLGRAWWLSWRSAHLRGRDPVRREAARWLRSLTRVTPSPELAELRAQLERLRYGPRETWPDARAVWSEARRVRRNSSRHRA
jgi:transglutaminase-like putative cysteine protease